MNKEKEEAKVFSDLLKAGFVSRNICKSFWVFGCCVQLPPRFSKIIINPDSYRYQVNLRTLPNWVELKNNDTDLVIKLELVTQRVVTIQSEKGHTVWINIERLKRGKS